MRFIRSSLLLRWLLSYLPKNSNLRSFAFVTKARLKESPSQVSASGFSGFPSWLTKYRHLPVTYVIHVYPLQEEETLESLELLFWTDFPIFFAFQLSWLISLNDSPSAPRWPTAEGHDVDQSQRLILTAAMIRKKTGN